MFAGDNNERYICVIRVTTLPIRNPPEDPYTSSPVKTWLTKFLNLKIRRMKKINSLLHNEKVQGNLFLGFIFTAIAVIVILTWGK
jgi:hypothetical protein